MNKSAAKQSGAMDEKQKKKEKERKESPKLLFMLLPFRSPSDAYDPYTWISNLLPFLLMFMFIQQHPPPTPNHIRDPTKSAA